MVKPTDTNQINQNFDQNRIEWQFVAEYSTSQSLTDGLPHTKVID